jgi:hypothetical protein
MNKTKLASITLCALLLPVMALAQLQTTSNVAGVPAIGTLGQIIGYIEKAVALVFSAIAVICFVVAGILFLTAGGAPEKVQSARSAFIWGIAGVVVGIMAFSIIAIVASVLQGNA